MTFNLFDTEERVLDEARRLKGRLADADPAVRTGVEALIGAYERCYREQRRLVRVSDRLQEQLATVNQELATRRREAEEALKRLEEAQETLVQSEKLASLGALVAGVAHEVNTPVGIALSCASHLGDATGRLRRSVEAGGPGRQEFHRYLETATDTAGLILANCRRAAELIQGFKQVAVDRVSAERRRFDLRSYLHETLLSLRPRLRQAGHALRVDCPKGIEIDGDPGALSQIVTNLTLNTLVHAYDEGDRGTITIVVDHPSPDWVRLVHRDDGKGIMPENLALVFDPFFTTRRGSGGTGLGLHIAYNLATGPLGGRLSLDSTPGEGTAVTLAFPRTASIRAEDRDAGLSA